MMWNLLAYLPGPLYKEEEKQIKKRRDGRRPEGRRRGFREGKPGALRATVASTDPHRAGRRFGAGRVPCGRAGGLPCPAPGRAGVGPTDRAVGPTIAAETGVEGPSWITGLRVRHFKLTMPSRDRTWGDEQTGQAAGELVSRHPDCR